MLYNLRGKWKKINGKRQFIAREKGRVDRKMLDDWVEKMGVLLYGGDVDESPHVYRRLSDVLECHKETIQILNVLKPLVVVMDNDRGRR